MKVAHLNTYPTGGAASFVDRLSLSLTHKGITCKKYCAGPSVNSEWVSLRSKPFLLPSINYERIQTSIENKILVQNPKTYFSASFRFSPASPRSRYLDCDIINLHWINRWIDLSSFFQGRLAPVPVVWSIHDLSAISGGCFADITCSMLEKECATCPALSFPFSHFLASLSLRHKVNALRKQHVTFVANSDYTLEMFRRSALYHYFPVRKIYPSLPERNPPLLCKADSRSNYQIPRDAIVLGICAADLDDPNKGFDGFMHCIKKLRSILQVPVYGIAIGATSRVVNDNCFILPGFVSSRADLNLLFSCLDILLVLSSSESFCQASIEAQSQGASIIGYGIGGVRETFVEGKTGLTAKSNDLNSLVNSILRMLDIRASSLAIQNARNHVLETFSLDKLSSSYQSLYQTIT